MADTRSAFHEVGHALICTALGGRVESITLEPRLTRGVLAATLMLHALSPSSDLLMLAAGEASESFALEADDTEQQVLDDEPIAEQTTFVERLREMVSPATQAQLSAEAWHTIASQHRDGFNERTSDKGEARALARRLGVATESGFEQLWIAAVDHARQILGSRRRLLDKIAVALIERQTLTHADLVELGIQYHKQRVTTNG